ncbi:MAG: hypothetical protein LKF31_04690 [Muribaculaceae bacterium]|nr:hypothetical protein [Muribaculaceae bacterium]
MQFEATHYAKRWKFFGTSAISNLLNNAKGNLIYQNTFRKWLNANSIELDNQEEMKDTCRKYLGENKKYLFEEFWTEYEANEGLRLPNTPFDKHYAESTKIVGIPLTCIEYNLNNQNYKLYIIGNNTLVAYDEVPSNIEAFKLNFKEKLRMALTEKSRLKAYATLAAYIFLCDGKSPEESKLLNCMVNELDMSDSKREKFMENIANIDTSLPYEDFRSKIKRLFKSKKTISFAWQCMAVDKQMSEQEKQLFTNICNEYDIDENEIDNLKRMASRFALLKDEEVAKEYCDIKKEFTSIKKKFWITTIIGTVSIMLGILACIFLPKIAYESTDSKSKVESVANTETETVAVVDSTSVNTSDNDMSDFDKFVDEIESWGTPAEYVKAHPLKSSDDYDKMNDIANKMYEDITNRANKMYESISADANKVYEKVSENANKQYEAKEIDYDACSKLTSDAYDKYSSIQSAAYDKYSNIQTKAYDWYSEVQSLYYDQQNGMNNN